MARRKDRISPSAMNAAGTGRSPIEQAAVLSNAKGANRDAACFSRLYITRVRVMVVARIDRVLRSRVQAKYIF